MTRANVATLTSRERKKKRPLIIWNKLKSFLNVPPLNVTPEDLEICSKNGCNS